MNTKSKLGYTPLHKAAGNGHLDVCVYIMEKIEDKNPRGLFGRTPLHEAACFGHLDICKNIMVNI